MSQAGVAYVTVKPDWQGFQREFNQSAARTIGPRIDGLGKDMTARLGKQLSGIGPMVSRALSTGTKAAAAGIAGGLAFSLKAASDFEQQISSLGAVADANSKQLDALQKSALKAGKDTAFSAREAAQAQTELAKGGLAVRDILGGGLDGALALAAAGEMDLAQAAATAVNAMKLFRIPGKQATRVADALATAANVTTADVSDFAMALTQGGAAAKTVGLSFRETTAALEALAETGVKGSDAGTSLKTALIQLASPTEKSAGVMEKLGIRLFDSNEKMKPLTQVAGELRKGLGGLTEQQRVQAATTLAGTDGFRALLALYDAGPRKIREYERGLARQGTAAEVAKRKQDNLKGSLEQLGGSAETLGINLGTLMIPAVRRAADELGEFTDEITAIVENDKLDLGEKLSKAFEVAKVDAAPWIDKLEVALKDADLPERFGEAIEFATPRIAEAAAAAAPLAAKTFINSFLETNAWGKLAAGTWLATKLGLTKGAFNAVLKTAARGGGGALGTVVSKAAPVPVFVTNPGFGPPGGTPGKGGKLPPVVTTGGKIAATTAAIGSRLVPIFASGAASAGLAATLIGYLAVTHNENLPTRGKGASSPSNPDGHVPFKPGGLERRAYDAPTAGIKDEGAAAMAAGAEQMLKRVREVARDIRKLREGAGGDFDEIAANAGSNFKRIADVIGARTDEGKRLADRNFKAAASAIASNLGTGKGAASSAMSAIEGLLKRHSKGGKDGLARNMDLIVPAVRDALGKAGRETQAGMALIEGLMVKQLTDLGLTKAQAINIAKTGDPDANRGREGGASSVIRRQMGGIVPGVGSGDKVPRALREGSFVLNREATAAFFGRQAGGLIPTLLEPGERVFLPDEVKRIGLGRLTAMNDAVKRFQEGGQVGRIPDAMGALPGLDALAYVLAKKFGLGVTSGLRPGAITTSGNPSDHGWGGAIDVSNGVTTPQMDAAHSWLGRVMGPAIKQMLYRTMVGGNHFNHIHVALQAAFANSAERVLALAGAGNVSEKLKRVLVGGPDSALKGLVQGSLDVAHAAAQSVVDDASTMAFGNLSAGSGGGSDVAAGKYSKEALKRLWISAGGPAQHANTMAAVALAESGGNPSIVNSIGAGGLWQIHPPEPDYLDPMTNARIAVRKFEERGFVPWEAYTNGSYTKFLQQGGLVSSLLRLAKGGPAKGRLPAGIDFGKALGKVRAGRSEKLRTAATEKLVARIQEIAPSTAGELARLKDQSDLFADLADRAGRLTDTGKIQDALQEELTRRQGLIPMPSPLFPPDAQQAIVDQLLGRSNGRTQLEWLTSQLTSLFDWRNVITDTTPLVKQLQDDTQALLDDAKQRLERVMDQLKKAAAEYKRVEQRRDRVSKREKTLEDRIKTENRKPANKRDRRKLRSWREELTETHAEHVELNQRLANMRGERRANEAVRDSLDQQIIPALDDKGKSLQDTMSDLLGGLVDIQGLGGSTKRLAVMPPLEGVGGRLLDVGSLIRELTDNPPRIEATVPAVSENQQRRADLLQELLTEERQRGLVREAALRTFGGAGDLPFAGSFDTGGMIPGPAGKPYAAIVHGREEILTVDDPRNQLNGGGPAPQLVLQFAPGTEWLRDFVQVQIQGHDRRSARNAARGLPSAGGGVDLIR